MSFNLLNKSCLVIILFFCFSMPSLSKEKIILAADKWCPYNCEPGSSMPGYMVEMASTIFAKYNIEIEYVLKPWDKAIEAVRQGEVHGIIGASFDETSDLVYPTVPQAYGIIAAFTLENSSWKYENASSIKGLRIGLILGYKYPDDIANYIFITLPKAPELFVFEGGADAVPEHVNNLINKKTDVYLENQYVMAKYINAESSPKIRNAGQVGTELDRLYIAFSPKLKKSYTYAKMLSEGMEDLRNSGKLAELYKKYGLSN